MKIFKIEINETEDGLLRTSSETEGFTSLELLGLAEHVKSHIADIINEEEE